MCVIFQEHDLRGYTRKFLAANHHKLATPYNHVTQVAVVDELMILKVIVKVGACMFG